MDIHKVKDPDLRGIKERNSLQLSNLRPRRAMAEFSGASSQPDPPPLSRNEGKKRLRPISKIQHYRIQYLFLGYMH